MSYLVLARKYRPQTFTEVVGQDHVTRTLANAFAADRVHHAFLFCGPRGVGKTTLARILGKALNCDKGPTAEPCGTCSACTTITAGSAVDYYEMDGASNRGIDAIRDLTEAVRYQPAALRKKVYVIDEVHMLTTEAFNALLKTLEEPPPHVTFVLATTEPHKVPNTILSRCQRYDFKLVPAARLAAHLTRIFEAETISVESGATSLLVRESGGSVRDALSLADQIISYVGDATITEAAVAEVLGVADRALTRTLVEALAQGDARTALETVDAAIDRGVDEVQVARAVVRYLRDLSVLQVAPEALSLVDASDEERAELVERAAAHDRSRILQMFERMMRASEDLGRTMQPRLILDLALIDLASTEPMIPLGDLIERLGDLEVRLAGGGGGSGGGTRPPSRASAPARGNQGVRSSAAQAPVTAAPPSAQAPVTAAPTPAPAASIQPPPAVASPVSAPVSAPVSGSGSGSGSAPAPASASATAPGSASAAAQPAPPSVGSSVAPPSAPAPAAAVASATTPSAPAFPTPPTGPKATPTDHMREWEAVLTGLDADRRFALLGYYEHARVLSWTDDSIEVGFSADVASVCEMASQRDHIEQMLQFLSRRYGKTYRLGLRVMNDADEARVSEARSILEVDRDRREADKQNRELEAREHPITKMVMQTFGADIQEIKTDVQ